MLRFLTLGAVDLRDEDGREIRSVLSQPKRVALLTYLTVTTPRGFHQRDTLLPLFWPESDAERARSALRQAVHQLRRSLGEGVLVGRGDGELGVDPERLWCDAAAFETALDAGDPADALNLYRGDLLPGFHLAAAPEWERWLDGKRDRLRERALAAASELAEREAAAGSTVGAVGWARRACAIAPEDETALRRLVVLLDRGGDRAGALRAYEEFARRLAEEYELEPSPETRAALAEIRARKKVAAPPAHPSSAAADEGFPPELVPAGPASVRTPSAGEAAGATIAVLPFADMSPEKDQQYFGDGLAEELINTLTRVEGLRVVARTSAFSFRDARADVREIGRRLGAAAVLEGSVRRSGDQVRITAQLIDAGTGYHLWSETYEREMGDVFAIQEEISDAIAGTLRGRLASRAPAGLATRPTDDMAAYDHYLRGVHFRNRTYGEDLKRAIEHFEAAIARDPGFALAHAGLADAYIQFPTAGLLPMRDAFERARTAASRALELDSSLAEAHAALGRIQFEWDWDFSGAERSYARAIALRPNYVGARSRYAFQLAAMGRMDDALAAMRQAIALDPVSLGLNGALGLLLYYDRRYDDAVLHLRRTLELDPDNASLHWYLGLALIQKESYPEAIRHLRAAATRSGASPLVRATLGSAYARAGQREAALLIRDQLLRPDGRLYLRPQGMVFLLSDLGDRDGALRWLERAVEEHSIHPYVLTSEPLLDPLRSDPRFGRLLRRAGLEWERAPRSQPSAIGGR